MAKLDRDDFKQIKDLLEVTIEEKIEKKGLATRKDLACLPTKNEFYLIMDKIMGKLRALSKKTVN